MKPDDLPLADAKFDPTSLPGVGPKFAAISGGESNGAWAPRASLTKLPELEPLRKNPRALVTKLGIGIHAATGDKIVFFNPAVLKPEEVAQIDKSGAIEQVFEPLLSGASAEPSPASAEPSPASAAPSAAAAPSTPVPPASGDAVAARVVAAKPKQPAQAQVPGGGSILNGLLARPK